MAPVLSVRVLYVAHVRHVILFLRRIDQFELQELNVMHAGAIDVAAAALYTSATLLI